MGKILIVKGADFSGVAVDGLSHAYYYESYPNLSDTYSFGGTSNTIYTQTKVNGASIHHDIVCGVKVLMDTEGAGATLSVYKVNISSGVCELIKQFTTISGIKDYMFDSDVNCSDNEYIGIHSSLQNGQLPAIGFIAGVSTSEVVTLTSGTKATRNNTIAYQRIYKE